MQQDTVLCVYTCINCNSIIIQTRGVCVCVCWEGWELYMGRMLDWHKLFFFLQKQAFTFLSK